METPKKRKGYPSQAQKTRLIYLLRADEELRRGKYSGSFTKKVAEERWAAITTELNSIPGPKKSWSEWRRTWQDMKAKSKKKETCIWQNYNATGGSHPSDSLPEDNKLLPSTTIKSEPEELTEIEESLVHFVEIPSSSQICQENPNLSKFESSESTKFLDSSEEEQDHTENSINKGHIDKLKSLKKTNKAATKKRLDESLDALRKTLEEKNNYKKIFYENYITEMRRQTDALLMIASNLKKQN